MVEASPCVAPRPRARLESHPQLPRLVLPPPSFSFSSPSSLSSLLVPPHPVPGVDHQRKSRGKPSAVAPKGKTGPPFPPPPPLLSLLASPPLSSANARMLSPLSPQPSLPSPTFTPLPSPSPSSGGQRRRTQSRRQQSLLARAFQGVGVGPSRAQTSGSESSGGFSRSGTGYGDGSMGGTSGGASSTRSRRTKRRHLELSEGDTLTIGSPLPTTNSKAPLKAVPSPPLPTSPSAPTAQPTTPEPELNRLEIVRQLGTGSYAVVYLVREVLDQPAGRKRSDSGSDLEWDMEGEDGIVGLGTGAGKGRVYGREFGELDPSFLSRPLASATVRGKRKR